VSSNGSEVYQKILSIGTHLGVIGQDSGVVQHRTNNGLQAQFYQGGWELLKGENLWHQWQQIAEQALELLTAEEFPNIRTNFFFFSTRPNDATNS
jgi:predicted Zn-dependent protease